ncbi:MAG TPA: hypothetical protein VF329_11145 [Gammaproteobacteria bacterium]
MHRERDRDLSFPPLPSGRAAFSRRSFLAAGAATAAAAAVSPAALAQSVRGRDIGPKFERVPTQFIAALGDREATSGNNAQLWGLWRRDPGPRGVILDHYERLKVAGVAPAGWRFDDSSWWLEEHGLIMESPEFPLPPGQYMVTGNREAKSILTVHAPDASGAQRWELGGGATLYDVTHLRCRSARYTPASAASSCSPAHAVKSAFPVSPGAPMPPVEGCDKQDYAVLIVIGVAVDNRDARTA